MTTKKIITGAVLLAILAGGGLWYIGARASSAENNQAEKNKERAEKDRLALAAIVEKDSDSDGLKDWEEALWKSAPDNPDSDGDGTSDGEEISQKRDPTKKGPKDALPEPKPAKAETTEGEADPDALKNLTATDIFARQFFTTYLAARDLGTLSEERKTEIFSNLVASANALVAPKTYGAADFKTGGLSESELWAYGNTVGGFLQRERDILIGDTFKAFERKIVAREVSGSEELRALAEGYARLVKNMLATAPPLSALSIHLRLTNSFSGLAYAISRLEDAENDPLAALIALKLFKEQDDALVKTLFDYIAYFKQNAIVFPPNEPGATFHD